MRESISDQNTSSFFDHMVQLSRILFVYEVSNCYSASNGGLDE